MTEEFFKVTDLQTVRSYASGISPKETQIVPIAEALDRVLAEDVVCDTDLPDFYRATMDGYAVQAASTFGAGDSNPAFLEIVGRVEMGKVPSFAIGTGQAARIATGGMLPAGADAVVMIEHVEAIDDTAIEVCRSVAPGQHAIVPGEDFQAEEIVISRGKRLRPQEIGLLAAFGRSSVAVYRQPVVAVISTGDEIVDVSETPARGQIRDINTHTLSGLIRRAGGLPLAMGICPDDFAILLDKCSRALDQADMVLISGGSSVGTRDFTIQVLNAIPESDILVHGIPISPGKPTILARAAEKMIWGLPGHVVSAMVVFDRVVRPFVDRLCGVTPVDGAGVRLPARLSRNVAAKQGRLDYVRVRLMEKDGTRWAEPLLGKSALINTMIRADGLIEIDSNTEGLEKGCTVSVILMD